MCDVAWIVRKKDSDGTGGGGFGEPTGLENMVNVAATSPSSSSERLCVVSCIVWQDVGVLLSSAIGQRHPSVRHWW